ncbi:MAG: ParB/RepB/Spo0J family partition protein [Verrucomicrobiaceae bacterium]|nr:MAG: ParB/RepB/Spo0J family partition protein [Verrucomicrobiaceae bacterium]
MQKNALGQGLGALISGASRRGAGALVLAPIAQTSPMPPPPAAEPVLPGTRVLRVPLDSIVASPMQPRRTFREEQLLELMDSIKEHGLIQPLIVRRVHGQLELIAGERRFRASKRLGLTDVPVIEREATDRDVLEMALIENLQREDLNPIEEAEAFWRLSKEFALRQEDIARRVGKNRATVANSMRLLDLPDDVKSLIGQSRLSSGHAKALLGLRDAALQSAVADQVVRQSMTVRQTERLVQQELAGKKEKPAASGKPAAPPARDLNATLHRIQSNLRHKLATNVTVHHGDKKGRIEIEYYGNDDLGRLLEVLGVDAE